jgi:hypothetical protein
MLSEGETSLAVSGRKAASRAGEISERSFDFAQDGREENFAKAV